MQEDKDAQLIMDLMRQAINESTHSAPPPSQATPVPQDSSLPNPPFIPNGQGGILVMGNNNYVAGSTLSVQHALAATSRSNAFVEHLEFQKAAKVKCSIVERSQLEWLVTERRFAPSELSAAMTRGGLRWSDGSGQLTPGSAFVSIMLIGFVFLVILSLFTFFAINWWPSRQFMDPVKFYGFGTLFLTAFAGFGCAIWHWSVVPLQTAFRASRALKESPQAVNALSRDEGSHG